MSQSDPQNRLAHLKHLVKQIEELGGDFDSHESQHVIESLLVADQDISLAPWNTEPRARLERVYDLNEKGLQSPRDYVGLLKEIIEANDPSVSFKASQSDLLHEVAKQMLEKAGSGTGEVVVNARDLAAWGNTIEQVLVPTQSMKRRSP